MRVLEPPQGQPVLGAESVREIPGEGLPEHDRRDQTGPWHRPVGDQQIEHHGGEHGPRRVVGDVLGIEGQPDRHRCQQRPGPATPQRGGQPGHRRQDELGGPSPGRHHRAPIAEDPQSRGVGDTHRRPQRVDGAAVGDQERAPGGGHRRPGENQAGQQAPDRQGEHDRQEPDRPRFGRSRHTERQPGQGTRPGGAARAQARGHQSDRDHRAQQREHVFQMHPAHRQHGPDRGEHQPRQHQAHPRPRGPGRLPQPGDQRGEQPQHERHRRRHQRLRGSLLSGGAERMQQLHQDERGGTDLQVRMLGVQVHPGRPEQGGRTVDQEVPRDAGQREPQPGPDDGPGPDQGPGQHPTPATGQPGFADLRQAPAGERAIHGHDPPVRAAQRWAGPTARARGEPGGAGKLPSPVIARISDTRHILSPHHHRGGRKEPG